MERRLKHVGADAMFAERSKLLNLYDAAKLRASDDPVATEHGVDAEAMFRNFLVNFLPKRYGVTKGYIITPSLEYDGPLEEWDIIVYDALESPVLYVRDNPDIGPVGAKRGIPVQYVKAVIEAKATFNPAMAKKACEKLRKVQHFIGKDVPRHLQDHYLPYGFFTSAVFFEATAPNAASHIKTLDEFSVFWEQQPWVPFNGAAVLRHHRHPDCSGTITHMMSGASREKMMALHPAFEVSQPFQVSLLDPTHEELGYIISAGYSVNEFYDYLNELIVGLRGGFHDVPGEKYPGLPSYGFDHGRVERVPLFDQQPA
jgi:hypothetical protein